MPADTLPKPGHHSTRLRRSLRLRQPGLGGSLGVTIPGHSAVGHFRRRPFPPPAIPAVGHSRRPFPPVGRPRRRPSPPPAIPATGRPRPSAVPAAGHSRRWPSPPSAVPARRPFPPLAIPTVGRSPGSLRLCPVASILSLRRVTEDRQEDKSQISSCPFDGMCALFIPMAWLWIPMEASRRPGRPNHQDHLNHRTKLAARRVDRERLD